MEKMATDRKQWHSLVDGLCSERAKRHKVRQRLATCYILSTVLGLPGKIWNWNASCFLINDHVPRVQSNINKIFFWINKSLTHSSSTHWNGNNFKCSLSSLRWVNISKNNFVYLYESKTTAMKKLSVVYALNHTNTTCYLSL